ncbi:MAG: leucine-rich repeat domain-containing protein [Longimicrobiaceae bacterium]
MDLQFPPDTEHLDLSDTGIDDLSPLRGLTSLTSLDISITEVSDLSPLRELTSLTSLSIRSTEVSDLSPIRDLTSLASLDIAITQMSDLSPLRDLTSLRSLDISNTEVSDLSPLRELTSLTALHIPNTQVSDLSPLRDLTSLASLDTSDTQVSDLSPIRDLTSLASLDTSVTQVSDLSPIRDLTSLTALHISDTQVSDLSPIRDLTSLASLDISNTQVSDLSPIRDLTSLASLDIARTQMSDLSPIRELTSLTSLHISRTQVSDLSPIRDLTSLASLAIWNTQVSDLSPIRDLTSLASLDISNTQVSDLSPIRDLTSLASLRISNTQASDLSPIRDLTSLASLDISNTQVSDLSPIRDLTSLASLDISNTQVSDLSPIRDLTSLASIDISNTQVSDLSPLADMLIGGWLRHMRVSGESLDAQPPELAQTIDPAEAFRSYFEDLRRGSQRNTDLKLVLIGNAQVGKSTLKQQLLAGELSPDSVQERTHGIDTMVLPWRVGEEELRLTVWDLAGQEIYHTMHRFLLHPRALFLLLWAEETDERDPQELHPAAYWLELVRQLGKRSVTVLVKNQVDRSNRFGTRPPELAGAEIPVAAEIAVSATKGIGMQALRETISEQIRGSRDRWGYLLPSSWLAVREDVERLKAAGHRDLPFAQFEQLCTAHDAQHPRVLAGYLHESGFLFHRAGFFSNRLILDQDWLLEKMYAVFDPRTRVRERIVRAGGVVAINDAEWIWPGHESYEHQVFLDFLTTSELAFRIGTWDSHSYVIPALLPPEPPPFRPDAASGDTWLELRYRVLHRALIERLIARLSGLSPHRQWWRYGIDIKAKDGSWTASVEAPPGENVLRIHVAAPRSSPRRDEPQRRGAAALLSLIENTLPGAEPAVAASSDGEVFIDLDQLVRARAEGRSHCVDTNGNACDVARLAQLPARRDLERLNAENLYPEPRTMSVETSKLKIFVSYAHKDEKHKDELLKRLKIIQRDFPIEFWDDRQLFAGSLVDDEIMKRLDAADITCLLISTDFLASDYCWTREMASALERYEQHGKLPVPIIVRRTQSWQKTKIGRHLALPKDGRPVSDWRRRDDFWADVEAGLRRLIEKELARKGGTTASAPP